MKRLATAESVTEGHPDKVCDQISDAILDAYLAQDPMARVAVEAMASGNTLFIAGEISSSATVSIEATARQVVRDIGYTRQELEFTADGCFILSDIRTQSPDISMGVSKGALTGAGDQGIFYGYACNETPSCMPFPAHLAHALSFRLAQARHQGILPWLRPDGKTQVTVCYDAEGIPTHLTSLVISAQHDPDVPRKQLVEGLVEHVLLQEVGLAWITPETRILINPTGQFIKGGPAADTGLTGRKIMVDTYGGQVRHGGGAFSGKDATKVDRTGAYMARYVSKNVISAGLAARCEIALAYAIGQPEPEMVVINTYGTETCDSATLHNAVMHTFSFSVADMIDCLCLRKPIFRNTASYGHFGRDEDHCPWERTDKTEELRLFCKG